VFEDKDKAKEVAAVVHKHLDEDDENKRATTHVEVQETRSSV
jgi:hypothetical protein